MPKKPPSLFHSQSYYSLLRLYFDASHSSLDVRRNCNNARKSNSNITSPTRANSMHGFDLNVSPLRQSYQNLRIPHLPDVECPSGSRDKRTGHHHYRLPTSQNSEASLREIERKKTINKVGSILKSQHNTNETIMQRSMPVFEVLPPLAEHKKRNDSDASTLLKQTSSGYLLFDYAKFLTSMNKKAKPSDRDVVFGSTTLLNKRICGWETSRIQWLLDLEIQQELQRQRRERRELKLQNSEDNNSEVNLCCFPFPPTTVLKID